MITALTADPLSIGNVGLTNYRAKPAEGERSMLPDSTPPAPRVPAPMTMASFRARRHRPSQFPKPSAMALPRCLLPR
jgi:hypothetical protein